MCGVVFHILQGAELVGLYYMCLLRLHRRVGALDLFFHIPSSTQFVAWIAWLGRTHSSKAVNG